MGMVEMVDSFQYLGIIATADGGIKEDVASRKQMLPLRSFTCIPEQKYLKK